MYYNYSAYLKQPLFYQTMSVSWSYGPWEVDSLLFSRLHGNYDFADVESELCDALETFFEMWLYTQWVSCLRQDLQQLVIG